MPRPIRAYRVLYATALLACSLSASASQAQTIYRWTDAAGTVHYSDDAAGAPRDAKVETLKYPTPVSPPPAPPAPAASATPTSELVPVPPPPEERDDEELWRSRFRAAHEKLRALEDEVAAEQRVIDNPTLLKMGNTFDCVPFVDGVPWPYGTPDSGGIQLCPWGPQDGSTYCACELNAVFERTRARFVAAKATLERARKALVELERHAANAAVPLEWRR